ncbi:MAG: adenylate kinase [Solirubrobacterales bacterium]|nr:adenylate kinase [Solirubrobacterales bacterium]
MADLNLILLGPPGAGKGTQAERLTEDFDLPYIATGNMLREAVEAGTALGREAKGFMDAGELVPDAVIIGMFLDRLDHEGASDGFILDGFPRTIAQAEALEAAGGRVGRGITAALLIDVPDDELVRRLGGRWQCREAGHPYHTEFNPPKVEGQCDIDGSPLVQREDDRAETVRNRLVVYHRQTAPLVSYYDDRALLHRVDGTLPPTAVHDHLRATVATLRMEDRL